MSGIVLPLPERLTSTSQVLATPAEVAPWVEAIIKVWDNTSFYEDLRVRALSESERWGSEIVEQQFVRLFQGL